MKVIIMSHERGGSYIMDSEGTFRLVRGYSSCPVGTEVEFRPKSSAKIISLLMCFVLILGAGVFGWQWNTEAYSVYVDINPSIELVFNNLNKLKVAKPLNEDGAALLGEISLSGSLDDAVTALVDKAIEDGYVDAKLDLPPVVVTVTARRGKSPDDYIALISSSLAHRGFDKIATVELCSGDYLARAEEMAVSPGKLKLAERLFASDPSVSIDDVIEMSVKDIMIAIKTAEEEKFSVPDENGKETNPNVGPGNNSGGDHPDNPNAGSGNNSGSESSGNPNAGSGSNSSGDKPDNPNAGPGNNSGGESSGNPNAGSGNNSGGESSGNPNAGSGNNSGGESTGNPNAGSGNNSGGESSGNPNAGSGKNSGKKNN